MCVDGRIAIVTGSGRGIGAAIAETLADAGAMAVICDIDAELGSSQAARIEMQDMVPTQLLLMLANRPNVTVS